MSSFFVFTAVFVAVFLLSKLKRKLLQMAGDSGNGQCDHCDTDRSLHHTKHDQTEKAGKLRVRWLLLQRLQRLRGPS